MSQELLASPISDLRLGGYQLLLEIASGGMATVYVARKTGAAGFERLVVIKRVHPHLIKNREFHDMFRDEARVCSTIRHPNVVAVIDVAEAAGELFLVLEYVESLALSALLAAAAERRERLPVPVLARIFADALAGLHAAHEAKDLHGNDIGLIHRDVSPQNIIVGLDGTSRLIDFGIAKAAARITATHSGVVKGKLRYMSPEQVQQKSLDRRADVFSAGIVLHEALTGQALFVGEDEGDVALGILIGEVPPPSSLVADLPPALDAVVNRALARSREERFQTALEFQEALEQAVVPATTRDVARTMEGLAGPAFELRRATLRSALTGGAGGSRVHKIRWRTAALALAVVVAVATTAVLTLGERTGGARRTEASLPSAAPAPARIDTRVAQGAATLVLAPAPPPASLPPITSPPDPRPSRRSDRSRRPPRQDLHRQNPYGAP